MFPKETRFLIVDDFPTMRKVMKKILSELGYLHVDETGDGETALPLLKNAAASDKPYEFIISDWNMPQMPGPQLLEACKADPKLRSIPFILVTAESDQEHIILAAKSGISDLIVKPFNAKRLKEKLDKIYQRTHRRSEPKVS